MLDLVLALIGGALIGFSLGALGGGGSILAVPVLIYALGQSPAQATTGSLVVVGSTAMLGAISAHRAGSVLLGPGAVFALLAFGGATVGARFSTLVSENTLLASFAILMVLVGGIMAASQLRPRLAGDGQATPVQDGAQPYIGPLGGDLTSPPPARWRQSWRGLKLLFVATVVGLLTGFLGVGGGFLVVPALLLVLAVPMGFAVGTSLVVIALTSVVALAFRAGAGPAPDWGLVLVLTVVSVLSASLAARVTSGVDTKHLSAAFTLLVLGVGASMGIHVLLGSR